MRLDDLDYKNSFVNDLPADRSGKNFPRQVHGAFSSTVRPSPVAAPRLVALSRECAALLDLDAAAVAPEHLAEVLSGNRLAAGMESWAAAYGGHQFGHWAGQLGDGRAISLGEVVNRAGERWELQLKGAGPTPYSRMGDGRAVMRSSVREFLCSEAMHHLGVPTTRALSLVATGEDVMRDMFYDGNPELEPGAIVCRVAPSFVRFGNFELFAMRGDEANLARLARYVLETHFAHLLPAQGEPGPDTWLAWFRGIAERTADMIVHWMRVGFVHGVMNTDNMSVLGLTIDYGPYGWLEGFEPAWTPNTTDAQGRRYCFGRQPEIGLWNLARFGSALVPLVGEAAPLQAALRAYGDRLEPGMRAMMRAKLGLREADDGFLDELHAVLQLVETDMTLFFRALADLPVGDAGGEDPGDDALLAVVRPARYAPERASDTADVDARTLRWLRDYAGRVRAEGADPDARRAAMNRVNPKYVLRNYLAQLAIDRAEQGDGGGVDELLEVLRRPYDDQPGRDAFAEKRPEWARHRAGCSMLSCSS